MAQAEIVVRRRKLKPEEKEAALLAEVAAASPSSLVAMGLGQPDVSLVTNHSNVVWAKDSVIAE